MKGVTFMMDGYSVFTVTYLDKGVNHRSKTSDF